ncbi:MAG TPA: glycoside hydrolase family 2 TIM barrel-domain containing protein [Phycisphaerae bacterium]|nr:glycoside hydrolase family 2 TIM barrel-domain containing protein [Phycisphaerae bacterium]HRY66501.1 glycoside hydrolase family 2 TIM barrel-domain containing protein [Phycisphaerae bacterium]HSA28613.1 glycoside hydrolase family 2 TIM barrel-domain containing protein [Phycisphaerae bacterium]
MIRRTLAIVSLIVLSPLAVVAEPTAVVSLNGEDWLLAPDPQNVGRDQSWFNAARREAKRTRVPWIIQDAFPGYHGVAWYWHDFTAPPNPRRDGGYLLRFWQVDYMAEVWLNGQPVGRHEGGESCFLLDVTKTIKPGAVNRLAVRVLNPTNEPIDGIVLSETPHRNKALPYGPGSAWDQGGIIDDVELLVTAPVRVADVFVRPDWKTGLVRIEATIQNAGAAIAGHVVFTLAPAAVGGTMLSARIDRALPTGETLIETQLQVEKPRLWELKEPFLYRLTTRVNAEDSESFDEHSVRFGFRDFRVENGAFRLNGKRIYLRSSHTGNCTPIGLEMPHDPDYLRRDLINAKFMGFNMIRFISGVAKRYQLDLCDEIGLMVYEEAYGGWCMAYSPKFAERYNESILGMIRRDRNHPSITIFGLLNETGDGPVFRHAVALLPEVRALDDTRLILLNSGSWSAGSSVAGIEAWHNQGRADPCVTYNGTKDVIKGLGITWSPGQLAFHPGHDGEYAVVRWTAPADDQVDLSAVFTSIAERATTDVHVLLNGQPLYEGFIHVKDAGPKQSFASRVAVKAGDTLDCVCGYGNGDYGADTTALAVTLKTGSGRAYDAGADFSVKANPSGAWSYGQMSPGAAPAAESFVRFPLGQVEARQGMVSNPGSDQWQAILDDQHPYQRVPHTAGIIRALRTIHGKGLPLFISEYGIGSGCDLVRLVRLYEQAGKPEVEDGKLYRSFRDQFLVDWERWKMAEAFGRPEDFFAQSNARMAGQRLLGINAIRSNPSIIGYSLTGTLDQGMTAEGLWTTFRELKPGTADAVFDGFAPLRWCLFAEPVNVYRKAPVRLEAVLANEDVLAAGEYPVKFEVFGPDAVRVFEKAVTVTIPSRTADREPPMVISVFAEDVVLDGPAGRYRFTATFQRGAAAAGESIDFYVDDAAGMPGVDADVALWGEDPDLAKWLTEHGVRSHRFGAMAPAGNEVILSCARAPGPDAAAAFRELTQRVEAGSAAVFLCPEVFSDGKNSIAFLPLANKGGIAGLPSWLYHKEEWCKRHPIFDGLPAGGLMDYTFYREVIPDIAFVGLDPPREAVAGGTNTSQGYSAGLFVAVYPLGKGLIVINTLNVRGNLGRDPVAERLLGNMLRYAAGKSGKP